MPKNKEDQSYLLKKTELGRVKEGFHKLPEAQHVYGKPPVKEEHGARDALSSWDVTKGSSSKQGGKNFIAMNREGIKNGYIDTKGLSEFRKSNEIKVQIKEGQKYYGMVIPEQSHSYGISNRPSTPIKNVICNAYGIEQEQIRQEREAVMNMLREEDLNKKKPPKFEASPKAKKKEVVQSDFKLSKFKNVPSKIKPILDEAKRQHQNSPPKAE